MPVVVVKNKTNFALSVLSPVDRTIPARGSVSVTMQRGQLESEYLSDLIDRSIIEISITDNPNISSTLEASSGDDSAAIAAHTTQITALQTSQATQDTTLATHTTDITAAQTAADSAQSDIDTHSADTGNPHSVTAAQVGSPTTSTFNAHTHYAYFEEYDEDVVAASELTLPSPTADSIVLATLNVHRDGLLMRRDPTDPPAANQYYYDAPNRKVKLNAADTAYFHVSWVRAGQGVD